MKPAGYYSQKRSSPVVVKVPLVHPIDVAGEEVAELWLSRPKLRDLRGVPVTRILAALQKGAEGGGEINLGSLPDDIIDVVRDLLPGLAMITPEESGAIDLTDSWTILPEVLGFLADFPATPSGSASP